MSSTSESSEVMRILVVDDHPLFRDALQELIHREPRWRICGKASGVTEALRLVEEAKPDLVIVDISLGESNGIDLIKTVSEKYEGVAMLVVSMHAESLYAERALRAGAMGYVMKDEPPKVVKSAIQKVLGGEIYLSHNTATSLVARLMQRDSDGPKETPFQRLSDREREVFRMMGEGKGAPQIARELKLSVATIHSFRARIKQKLNLTSSAELLLQAINWVRKQADGDLSPSP
jgi:DNA-binding NarL/FixJ family response regulator